MTLSSSIDPNITTSGKNIQGDPTFIQSPNIEESNVQPTRLGTRHSSDAHMTNEMSSTFNSSMASIYGNSCQDCTCLQDSFPQNSSTQTTNVHELHLTISQANEINNTQKNETPESVPLVQSSVSSEQHNSIDVLTSVQLVKSEPSASVDNINTLEAESAISETESVTSEIYVVTEFFQNPSTQSNNANSTRDSESQPEPNDKTITVPPEQTPRSKTPPPYDNTTMCCLLL